MHRDATTWRVIRSSYVESRVIGEPLSVAELSRMYHVSHSTIANRAKREKWDHDVVLALSGSDPERVRGVTPIIQEETARFLRQGGVEDGVKALVATEVGNQIDTKLKPYLEMLLDHQDSADRLRMEGNNLLGIVAGVATSIEDLQEQGFKPRDIIALARLGYQMVIGGMKEERLIHERPTSVKKLDATLTIEDKSALVDSTKDAGFRKIQASLVKLLGNGDDEDVIEAEFVDPPKPFTHQVDLSAIPHLDDEMSLRYDDVEEEIL